MSLERPHGRLHRLRSAATDERLGIGGFILVYLYLLRDIQIGRMYAFGDLPPYYGTRAFAKFYATWHPHQLGYSHLFNTIPAYMGAITSIGGEIGQNLFYLSLVPIGFLTFYVFVRRFVDGVPRVLAAGVYALNPITIQSFVNGGIGALIAFAGIPLVLHYLYEITERDEWWPALKAGMVFGAIATIPYLAFWMVLPFAAYLLYRERQNPRIVAKLGASGLVGVVLALPSVHYLLQRGSALDSADVMFNHVEWNYAAADPLTVIRLAGNRGAWGMNQLGYNSDPTMLIGLIIPAMALLAWRREELRYLFVVTGALALFMVLTRYRVTYPLFELFPPLFSIRNPLKLQYPLLIAMSVLFGAGIRELFREVGSVQRKSVLRLSLVVIIVIPLFGYVAPASGALGLEETRGDEYYIPEEYDEVAASLDGKVLWVPYSYTTQLRLRHAYPEHVGIRSEGLVQGKENAMYVTELFDDFAEGQSIASRLNDLGVRYVVVDETPQTRYPATTGEPRLAIQHEAPWLFGDPEALNHRFSSSSAYTKAFTMGSMTVYEVRGTPERDRIIQETGLHAVLEPEEPTLEPHGENLLVNPRFEDGLDGWWTPSDNPGRETQLVDTSEGPAVAMSVDEESQPRPLAQSFAVEEGHPYHISFDAEGDGLARLVWFDGETSPENRIESQTVSLDESSVSGIAQGDTLAIRILPDAGSDILVREVALHRTTYPPATGRSASADIPGVTVDHGEDSPPEATVVAVNLDEQTAREVGAEVQVIDAETVVAGPFVFNETYRQGVGVRLDRENRPPRIPADAHAVTYDTSDGRVVDYWVIGEFDTRPVTMLYTSYNDRWLGPEGSTHFEADGWANGFLNAEEDEISWSDDRRGTVIRLWILSWLLAGGALTGRWGVSQSGWIQSVGERRDSSRSRRL